MERQPGSQVIHVRFERRALRAHDAPKTFPAMVRLVCALADEGKITVSVIHRTHGFEIVLGSDEPIPTELLAAVRGVLAYIPCSIGEPHVAALERISSGWEQGMVSDKNPDARTYTAMFDFAERDPLCGHDCFGATTDGPCTVQSIAISFIRRDGTSVHPDQTTSGIVVSNLDYVPTASIISQEA